MDIIHYEIQHTPRAYRRLVERTPVTLRQCAQNWQDIQRTVIRRTDVTGFQMGGSRWILKQYAGRLSHGNSTSTYPLRVAEEAYKTKDKKYPRFSSNNIPLSRVL